MDLDDEELEATKILKGLNKKVKKDLKYDDYKKYKVKPSSIGFYNFGHKFVFPNGYGASVIRCKR